MRFARDLLLIDIETTGPNPEKDFPIQLAAVLLDRDNLLEKLAFNTYIKHPFSQTTNDRIVQTLNIPKDIWMRSPNLKAVIAEFKRAFDSNITLASQNIININFLQESFKRTGIPYEYDYHILELWTIGYLYIAKQNIRKLPTAETVAALFKISSEKEHDALSNCRFHADILRKLVSRI
jgi:DNA polymerase III alpha subunit (gram-positive type)